MRTMHHAWHQHSASCPFVGARAVSSLEGMLATLVIVGVWCLRTRIHTAVGWQSTRTGVVLMPSCPLLKVQATGETRADILAKMGFAERLQQRPVTPLSRSPQRNDTPPGHASVRDEAAKLGPKAPAAGSSPELPDLDVIDRIASPVAEHTVDQQDLQHEAPDDVNRCRAFRYFCRTSGVMKLETFLSTAILHATPAS